MQAVPSKPAKVLDQQGHHGFTLIELLVVIAILSLLAAILFSVFSSARERARRTACLSNCKQIGLALGMYCHDNDSSLPAWSSYWVCASYKEAALAAPSQTVFVGDGGRDGRLLRQTDYQGYKDKYVIRCGALTNNTGPCSASSASEPAPGASQASGASQAYRHCTGAGSHLVSHHDNPLR